VELPLLTSGLIHGKKRAGGGWVSVDFSLAILEDPLPKHKKEENKGKQEKSSRAPCWGLHGKCHQTYDKEATGSSSFMRLRKYCILKKLMLPWNVNWFEL